jgi:hypothetical protein
MPQGRVEGQGKVEGEAGGFPLAPGVRLRSFGYPGRVTSEYRCWVMQCCAPASQVRSRQRYPRRKKSLDKQGLFEVRYQSVKSMCEQRRPKAAIFYALALSPAIQLTHL